MQMEPASFDGAAPVDGYGPGFFRVGGQVFHGPVLVTPRAVLSWGGFDDLETLKTLIGQIDVVFLGTGAEMALAPASMIQTLEPQGVMVEPMATPTAARSYNVTLAEGRRVACALIPV